MQTVCGGGIVWVLQGAKMMKLIKKPQYTISIIQIIQVKLEKRSYNINIDEPFEFQLKYHVAYPAVS